MGENTLPCNLNKNGTSASVDLCVSSVNKACRCTSAHQNTTNQFFNLFTTIYIGDKTTYSTPAFTTQATLSERHS